MSTSTITTTGFVVNDPVFYEKDDNKKAYAAFRFASTPRYFSKEDHEYVDGNTSWFEVRTFGRLADNVAQSIKKGDPLVITGDLRTRIWNDNEGNEHTSFAINSQTIGHDLMLGISKFERTTVSAQDVEDALTDNEIVEEKPDKKRK